MRTTDTSIDAYLAVLERDATARFNNLKRAKVTAGKDNRPAPGVAYHTLADGMRLAVRTFGNSFTYLLIGNADHAGSPITKSEAIRLLRKEVPE